MTGRRTESDRYAGATAAGSGEEADRHLSVTIDRHFWMIIDNSRDVCKFPGRVEVELRSRSARVSLGGSRASPRTRGSARAGVRQPPFARETAGRPN